MTRTILATIAILLAGPARAEDIDLLADPGVWAGNVDREGPTIALSSTDEAPLVADVTTNGGEEDYPKLRISFAAPEDLNRALRMRTRLRVTSDDPNVTRKRIAFVFYDEQTRRDDLEGRPMTQQIIAHDSVPVGQWLNFTDPLTGIHRSAIRQLDLYIYELPPATAHTYRWEFAELTLQAIEGDAVVFDGEPYGTDELSGGAGAEVGSVATDDGLVIDMGEAGGVAAVRIDGQAVGAADGRPSGLLVRDVAEGGPPVQVGGTLGAVDGAIHQQATLDDLSLSVDATWRSIGECIEVAGIVADLRGEDRAVTLYLALPLAEAPWRWWDDAARSRIEAAPFEELANFEAGAQFGLGGRHSRYPLGCVDAPGLGGLTLAIRMDEPVMHRIAFSPSLRTLFVALDFGLVPITNVHGRSLAEAPFRVLIARHDPAWGMRSALARYRALFPEFFERRTQQAGGWYVWGDMQEMPEALEAGFRFHWGPRGVDAVRWADEHGVTSLLYIEPEFYQQTHGDLDRAPSAEEALARITRLAAGDPEEIAAFTQLGYARSYVPQKWVDEHSLAAAVQAVARAGEQSLQHNGAGRPILSVGQYSWMSESRWGVIFPCNLDPDIPEGKGWFCRNLFIEPGLQAGADAGAHYDGIALDSFGGYGQTARADYRREHFQYADIPPCFGANDRRPCIVSSFASIEWLRELAADMHARGLVLMANCSWGGTPAWLAFAGPYLDIFGAEAATFADPDFIRFVAGDRPCSTLPYDPRPEWETARHLLHGIWSGHGNDTQMLARLDPILRRLDAAGWQPITGVRAKPASVHVERFGEPGEGTLYFVAHNPAPEGVQARLVTDPQVLGERPRQVESLYGPAPMPAPDGAIVLSLGPQETAVVGVRAR
ncbi:MAG: hypothetical protein AB7Y46_05935 [Armatimonadota bacterium]